MGRNPRRTLPSPAVTGEDIDPEEYVVENS